MLLKLSFFQRVTPGRAYRGRQLVSHGELVQAYGGNLHMSKEYMDSNCVWVNDLFSLSEACLLSDVVQIALDMKVDFDPHALQQDVANAISHVHSSGIMHRAVSKEPAKYLHANPALKSLLKRWKDADKQLFLLTNSSFPFVHAGMTYIVDDENWEDLFDIVVMQARKPWFFTKDAPFRSLSDDCTFPTWYPVTRGDLDRVLIGGSVERLSNLAGWENKKVLYFGDHLHADLMEPRRTRGWYTGAIIRELENEFEVQQKDEYKHILATIFRVESLLRDIQTEHSIDETVDDDSLQRLLDALENTRVELYERMGSVFNRHFGSIFRSHGDPSAYGLALYKGCDLYTTLHGSRISRITYRIIVSIQVTPIVSHTRSLWAGNAADTAYDHLSQCSCSLQVELSSTLRKSNLLVMSFLMIGRHQPLPLLPTTLQFVTLLCSSSHDFV